MKVRNGLALLVLGVFGATPAFAGSVNFSFGFAGSDSKLGSSQTYLDNGAAITAFGYKCSAATASSTDTLSGCTASDLYQKNDGGAELGLGLFAEGPGHEIGFDGSHSDYVMGLNVSDLYDMGATTLKLSFGSVEPGEAFAVLGYASDPFLAGTPFALSNTKAWFGNNGSYGDIDSATFDLNAQDQFLVLIAPCGASSNPSGPCGSNVTLLGLSGATPEPATIALFATGLLLLGSAARKRLALARR